jgi:phosphoglycerate dehydrogenase-like enzyme
MNIVICTPHFPHCGETLHHYLPLDTIHACPADRVREEVKTVDVIIPAMFRVDADIIARTSAKLIQQFGVGLEGVDIPAATQRGIYVANVPGHEGRGNAESVAEHAVYLMLALARKFPTALANVKQRKFGAPLGSSLTEKTAAILGVGSIGVATIQRLRGFRMRLLGVKQHPSSARQQELGLDFLGGPSDLFRILEEADFVVSALPLTPATRGLFDATAFTRMKNSAFLINVGRGPVINHNALLHALQSGTIAGAGLDVFWDEPIDPHDPIFQHNVIATPHIAGVTDLSYLDLARSVAANVNRLRVGQEPLHCVNLTEVAARRRARQ